jgi:hypothetical protein
MSQGCPHHEGEMAAACRAFNGDVSILQRVLESGGAPTEEQFLLELAEAAAEVGSVAALNFFSTVPSFRGWSEEPEVFRVALETSINDRKTACVAWLLDPGRSGLMRPQGPRRELDHY